MPSTHPDRRKLYVRIADELREELAAGRYPVGESFPSIGDLAERFSAAKMTVDRAVEVLRGEGYLESKQGSRTVVLALPDAPADQEADGQGRSEEFRIISAQLQEMRSAIKKLSDRLDGMDERTSS